MYVFCWIIIFYNFIEELNGKGYFTMEIKIKKEELIQLVFEATKLFFEENKRFPEIHELALTNRLAFYLQTLSLNKFHNYIVDCDYNKNKDNPKILNSGKFFRPDIILHKRSISDNLIVIEMKKRNSNHRDRKRDKFRLEELTTGNNKRGITYELGVFILVREEKVELTFFENGEEIPKEIILGYLNFNTCYQDIKIM